MFRKIGSVNMRTMVMSFKPDVYERIACGQKIFEHRRTFPDETIKVYMYVSKPICAVMGILLLGKLIVSRNGSKSLWRIEKQ